VRSFDFLAHADRAREIFSILARNGFADLLQQAGAPTGPWRKILPHPAESRTKEERIRMTAEELGPAFVKFGQMMSMRPDLIPQALILELRKLQENVHALPFSEMRPVLDESLGQPHGKLLADFDETPAASASLAQVYFARLHAGGRAVAVKVQKPGIGKTIEIDLGLAAWFAGQLDRRIERFRPYDLPSIVREVRKGVLRELDFRLEAGNQAYFNAVNPYPDKVFAPEVIKELSSERVLVMERVVGTSVGACRRPKERMEELAANGATSLIHQVLVDGFFHADPHAGNVIVTHDDRLAFIDWGMVGHLTPRLRHALADFWIAAVEQDAERLVRIAAELASSDARPDLRAMEQEVMLALREEFNFASGRLHLGRAMLRMIYVFGTNGIPLSREYSLMAKAVFSIEEVGYKLSPDFDMRVYAKPVLEQLQRERWGPRAILGSVGEFLKASIPGLRDVPMALRQLARRFEHDNLTINLQHRGLESLERSVRMAANRIALGVILGSLIIGSSLISRSGTGPRFLGLSALGTTGYLISAVFGLYVIYDIMRHGRHR